MDSFLTIGNAVAQWGLAIMGIYVTFNAIAAERHKAKWLLGFGAIALLSTCFQVWQTERQEAKLETRLTGGDNYAWIKADEEDLKARKDELRVWVCATGHMFNVSIHPYPFAVTSHNDPAYKSVWSDSYDYVGGGCNWTRFPVSPGKYRVDLSARNGYSQQTLEIITPPSGPFKQTCSLLKNGAVLQTRCPNPP